MEWASPAGIQVRVQGKDVPESDRRWHRLSGRLHRRLGGLRLVGGCRRTIFAVADEGERLAPTDKVSGTFYHSALRRPIYRWYLIKQVKKNPDGPCRIKIERIRWAAVDAGAPNLYKNENYTWDGHVRPLRHIIAAGAYAYDVGDGFKDVNNGLVNKADPRTIRVAKNADRGTPFDFAPGDPIEQAIRADPAIPVPIRVRMFNRVPDTQEQSALELSNYGRVQMHNGIALNRIGHNRDELNLRVDNKLFYANGLHVSCVVGTGVRFAADVTEAAIAFEQPNEHEQPIKWRHDRRETSLVVDPKTGEMRLRGSELDVPSVKGARRPLRDLGRREESWGHQRRSAQRREGIVCEL